MTPTDHLTFDKMTPEQRADLRERFLTAVAETYRLPKRVLSGDTGPVTAEQARDMERFYDFVFGGLERLPLSLSLGLVP